MPLKEVLEAPCRMYRLAEMRLLMPTGVARYAAFGKQTSEG